MEIVKPVRKESESHERRSSTDISANVSNNENGVKLSISKQDFHSRSVEVKGGSFLLKAGEKCIENYQCLGDFFHTSNKIIDKYFPDGKLE